MTAVLSRHPEPELDSGAGPASVPRVPTALVWVCGVVVAAGVALAVLGAVRTGITWDEPYHVMRLRSFLEHGWFALEWAVGEPGQDGSNTAVYGPVTMLLLHGLSVLLGVDTAGTVATTTTAYDVRHLGVVAIGLVGTAAAASTTRILLGSWRWALVTAATLLALPMWTGHLMFNIKDVPVATGYTMMTAALVAMVGARGPGRLWRVLALAGGVTLMVGTRPAMALAVGAALAVLTTGVLASAWRRGRSPLGEAAAGVLFAAVILVLTYPRLFADPAHLLTSAAQSSSFRGGSEAVVGYVPFFVLAQTPLLLLGLSVAGGWVALVLVCRRWRHDPVRATMLALVLAQLLAVPLFAMVRQSDLYNGLRQLLFAAPAWAVLTTVGIAYLASRQRRPGSTHLLTGLASVALVVPVLDQAAQFPYGYTYYNVALDAVGVRVPSDYWRASSEELAAYLPTDGQIVCGPTRTGPEDDPARMTAGRYSSDSSVDCRTDPLGPLASVWSERSLPLGTALPSTDFYVLIDRGHPTPANCVRLEEVTRARHGREVVMTYAARCRLDPPPLGSRPVRFTRQPQEQHLRPDLWAFAPQGWVMRRSDSEIEANGEAANLTFDVGEGCAVTACALRLTAAAPQDLTATVGGVAAPVLVTGPEVSVQLPRGTGAAWLTLQRRSGKPLDLRVSTIQVTPSGPSTEAADGN